MLLGWLGGEVVRVALEVSSGWEVSLRGTCWALGLQACCGVVFRGWLRVLILSWPAWRSARGAWGEPTRFGCGIWCPPEISPPCRAGNGVCGCVPQPCGGPRVGCGALLGMGREWRGLDPGLSLGAPGAAGRMPQVIGSTEKTLG